MNTKTKGDIAEAQLLAAFVKAGYNVLLPWGDNSRYDLVIERDDVFQRVQVKYSRFENGCIMFNAYSVNLRTQVSENYIGQAELFGVYSLHTDKCYLIPVEDVGTTTVYMRVDPPKSPTSKKFRWAETYEIQPCS